MPCLPQQTCIKALRRTAEDHCSRMAEIRGLSPVGSTLQSEEQQRSQPEPELVDIPCQLVTCRLDELRPHSSYVKHGLSVPACKIAALDRLGNRAFQDPIVVTQDRLIIDGYARWELAKKRGMVTISCLVYQRTEDEALRDLLWRHRQFDGLNDFTLIELSRDLKLFSAETARLHQQAGGQRKGSAKLEASERVDSRKERAQILVVSEGNVSKVDRILDHACSSTKQAARDKEISIHKAEKWSRQTEARQIENLRALRIEQGIRKKARNLVARLAAQPDEGVPTTATLQRLLQRVSTMSPEQSKAFGPVVFGCLHVPGKRIYVTDELIRAFKPQQEVLIE
jgi:ParB-like chromosome segregation protein Spo0J